MDIIKCFGSLSHSIDGDHGSHRYVSRYRDLEKYALFRNWLLVIRMMPVVEMNFMAGRILIIIRLRNISNFMSILTESAEVYSKRASTIWE